MRSYEIRNECPADYREVEELTRKAFWNVHVPGCDEHYLVHIMRKHPDFIPELDFVIEVDGKLIGNVMYARSKLVREDGTEKEILTFGPVSILPEYQRQGYGKQLLEYSFDRAREMSYDVIVIYGHPGNYVARGFQSARRYQISVKNIGYPSALLVKELQKGSLGDCRWDYRESSVYEVDAVAAEKFDQEFPAMQKKVLHCQEEFYIYSHSRMQ